jgi:hypothetical protein
MKSDLTGKEESLLETGGALHVNVDGSSGTSLNTNVGDGYHSVLIDVVVVKPTPGVLHRVVVNSPTPGSVIDIYDDIDLMASIVVPTLPTVLMPFVLEYDMAFYTSLIIETSVATSDVTVIFE